MSRELSQPMGKTEFSRTTKKNKLWLTGKKFGIVPEMKNIAL